MYFTDLRLKIIDFIRKHKYKIYIALIVLTIIIGINMTLGRIKDAKPPSTAYDPHDPIISGDKITSKKAQQTIETKIKEFMDFAKAKDYESAYNILSDDCKKYCFNDKIDKFKIYVNSLFSGNKVYSIQDFSNKDNVYIYEVSIFEDIMATGMNGKDSDKTDLEKVVLTKDGNDYKLAVKGFIKAESLNNKAAEDEYMKLSMLAKVTYYDKIVYRYRLSSKTDNIVLLERDSGNDWIGVSLNGETRKERKDFYNSDEKVVRGNQKLEFESEFPIYFDEAKQPTAIIFNKICILEKYTGVDELWEKELKNAVKTYSLTIDL
ncbi:MAG: hypothetical protein IJH39_02110 [Clostridia bacterium]|nr:hypothetical protein [Clostridia bacterium]